MTQRNNGKPHVVFLFSDTGGGHRSAAEAIIEALGLEFPGAISTEMVDFFKKYAPPPFDLAPETYLPDLWKLGFNLSNGRRRTKALVDAFWPYIKSAAYRLIEEHPCDLFVSVHPVVNDPVLRALQPGDPAIITVVTDLVSTHAFWYQNKVDLLLVPTETARERGLMYGMRPDQVQVVGLPVADRFCAPPADKRALRALLGWPRDLPVILLIGGGEGMGPVGKVARVIGSSNLRATLVVVTGRNRKLKARLESSRWTIPTFIYGFVREMPEFMRAADIVVTKAGPGTISEAFIAGLPLILFSRMPGQEDGNVTYVVNEGAGVWAPQPAEVLSTLNEWLDKPALRQKVTAACLRLAKPDASRRIARIIASKVLAAGVSDLSI
jgi:1,2-diacylglycerol 3-beta-galactosyltransferase